MSSSLSGHNALVTGGGSGIGLACAKAFARDGAAVTLMGRNVEKLERAAAEISASGGRVQISAGDVGNRRRCRQRRCRGATRRSADHRGCERGHRRDRSDRHYRRDGVGHDHEDQSHRHLLYVQTRRRGDRESRRRFDVRDLVDRRRAYASFHGSVLREQGRHRHAGAQHGGRDGRGESAREQRVARSRRYRNRGRTVRHRFGARGLSEVHADQPHRHGGRHRRGGAVSVRTRGELDHRYQPFGRRRPSSAPRSRRRSIFARVVRRSAR